MSVVLSRLEKDLNDQLDMLCIKDKRSRSFKIREIIEKAICDFEADNGKIEIDFDALKKFRGRNSTKSNPLKSQS